jgi:hypothetical protein
MQVPNLPTDASSSVPLSQSLSFVNAGSARMVVVERRLSWERVTEREEFVGRISFVSRFPQYFCPVGKMSVTEQNGSNRCTYDKSEIDWRRASRLDRRHLSESEREEAKKLRRRDEAREGLGWLRSLTPSLKMIPRRTLSRTFVTKANRRPRYTIASSSEIADKTRDGWTNTYSSSDDRYVLEKEFTFKSFRECIRFMGQVAPRVDELNVCAFESFFVSLDSRLLSFTTFYSIIQNGKTLAESTSTDWSPLSSD